MIIQAEDFQVLPDTKCDSTYYMNLLLAHLVGLPAEEEKIVCFECGRYDFFLLRDTSKRNYHISNHNQYDHINIAVPVEGLKNVVFEGNGSSLVFHSRLVPFALVDTVGVTMRNFSVDWEFPTMHQVEVLQVSEDGTWMDVQLNPLETYGIINGKLHFLGTELDNPHYYMTFEANGRLAYRISDRGFHPTSIKEIGFGKLRLTMPCGEHKPGQFLALRPTERPTPAFFLYRADETKLENIDVHFAQGMGVLAQRCTNVTLDGFNVKRRGDDDPRRFTLHADATHFVNCRGEVKVVNCLFEAMADDAINVHGCYLKTMERLADGKTLRAAYIHPQAYGYEWGLPGDEIMFINSATLAQLGDVNKLVSIKPCDVDGIEGAKEYLLTFEKEVPEIPANGDLGIENLTWTSRVVFKNNVIRNNRARGALFSTPKSVLCEGNFFDHTHGAAILLCGDCNGWYESGACRDVVIKGNRFLNALTSMYQFTDAVISLSPVIKELDEKSPYFHSNINIIDNTFETFDAPLVAALSAEGIVFIGNTIIKNQDFEPFHENKTIFTFDHVRNVTIGENVFPDGYDPKRDCTVLRK